MPLCMIHVMICLFFHPNQFKGLFWNNSLIAKPFCKTKFPEGKIKLNKFKGMIVIDQSVKYKVLLIAVISLGNIVVLPEQLKVCLMHNLHVDGDEVGRHISIGH